jgi:phospholipase A2
MWGLKSIFFAQKYVIDKKMTRRLKNITLPYTFFVCSWIGLIIMTHTKTAYPLTIGWSDTIKLENTTDHAFETGIYYVFGKKASRVGQALTINPKEIVTIKRPGAKIPYYRYLLLSTNHETEGLLKEELKSKDLDYLIKTDIGLFQGSKFYITSNTQHEIIVLSSSDFKRMCKYQKRREQFEKTVPHANRIAFVETGNSLMYHEDAYFVARIPTLKKHIEQLVGTSLSNNQLPRIALCCSGGGIRAMLATAGLLAGAEKTGLLGATSYAATLSGSSWAVISWLVEQQNINIFLDKLAKRFKRGIIRFSKKIYKAFAEKRKLASAYSKELNAMDIYGLFLANTILQPQQYSQFNITLSDLAKFTNPAIHPYPIFTTVMPVPNDCYAWLEFSPYQVKSSYLNAGIPSWALGRTFKNGTSTRFYPEPDVAHLMGVFGSSFCVSINEAIIRAKSLWENAASLLVPDFIGHLLSKYDWANTHFFAARFANFSYGLPHCPLNKIPTLTAIDAGYACNIPLESLLQQTRNIDIIIILDCRQEPIPKAKVLNDADRRARKCNLPIPPINYTAAKEKPISIFRDPENPRTPAIVYLPLRKDAEYDPSFDPTTSSFCSTTNFSYTEKQASKLINLTQHLITKHHPKIVDLIKTIVEDKTHG